MALLSTAHTLAWSDATTSTPTAHHLQSATTHIRPSGMRHIDVVTSHVTWADVGGLHDAKQRLQEMVV